MYERPEICWYYGVYPVWIPTVVNFELDIIVSAHFQGVMF